MRRDHTMRFHAILVSLALAAASALAVSTGCGTDLVRVLDDPLLLDPKLTPPQADGNPTNPDAPPVEPEKLFELIDQNAEAAEVVCPTASGQTPGDCLYRVIKIHNDELAISLSFKAPADVQFANALIQFPEYLSRPDAVQSFYDSGVSLSETTGTILELTDSRVRGIITGTVDRVAIQYHRPHDPTCMSDDIAGYCGESVQRNIPFRIEFDVAYE